MSADSETPNIPYWHVWTDDEGVTHQTPVSYTHLTLPTILLV